MKKYRIVILFLLFTLATVSLELVSADNGDNPYYQVETIEVGNGKFVEKTTINGPSTPPPGFEHERKSVALPKSNSLQGSNSLPVPAFDWYFGCSATSGAMIAAYYDRNGYPNMYTGPTNGGVMPPDSSPWDHWNDGYGGYYEQCPLTASHSGLDGRTTRGSIDDYWIQYDSSSPDPYITNGWTQHTWGDAIGDYMKTSQSAYSNTDGSTTFYTWTSSPNQLTCSKMVEESIHTHDGTYGRKLFYEARGYTVTDCYNQKTDNNYGGFTYAMYKAEIDAGHPVMLNLEGHTVVGVGYSDPNTVYIHDTWDYGTYSFPWGGSYLDMELLSVSIVNLASAETGTLQGIISEAVSGTPVVGATVTALGSNQTTSGDGGVYSMSLPTGVYTVTASALGYDTTSATSVTISADVTTTLNLSLLPSSSLWATPATLETTILTGTSTTLVLTLTNGSSSPIAYSMLEDLGEFHPYSTSNNSPDSIQALENYPQDARKAPESAWRNAPAITINGIESSILLNEGFEGGVVPPIGWSEVVSNSAYNWQILTAGTDFPYNGSYAADVKYDPGLYNQNEWLLSPEVNITWEKLSFWSMGSVYWCRETYDNCDLNVWLVIDDVGGGDDIFVGKGDDVWPANFTWTQSEFDLAPYLLSEPVRIGFQYVGLDGAQVAIDDIRLTNSGDIPWLSTSPITGTIPAGASQEIDVTFDASVVAQTGQYTGTLHIISDDLINPDMSVPVLMNVFSDFTISGNAGVAGAILSYIDDVPMNVIAEPNGNYALTVAQGWSGTVTPSKAGYIFSPASRSYNNVHADQTGQNYTARFAVYIPIIIR